MTLDPDALRATLVDYGVRTLWALLVVVVALVIARGVRLTAMRALARHRAHANATVLLGNLAQVLVLAVGLLAILAIYTQGAFGWILTSFSVVGIVVGLSLQDILKNFFAGLWVLVERPFRIGDSIQIGLHTGEVREISFRTTQLRTPDGREVIIPNASLMTEPVVNLSRYPLRRSMLLIGMPAEDADQIDPSQVRQALVAAGAVAEPPALIELRSVAEGKALFQVTFWASEQANAVAPGLAALRARFPQAEVRSAAEGPTAAAYFGMNVRGEQ